MECYIFSILFLVLTMESQCSPDNGFFISGPGVFHVGVKEKVFVQMGRSHLNNEVTLYLEHETSNTVLSERKTATCTVEGKIETVELMIDREIFSRLPLQRSKQPYFNLIAESPSFSGRKSTRVLISKHRGYIFIQTHQPVYNPTQTVRYRIFTLDQTLRPNEETFQLSVFNAAGNRIINSLITAKGGIIQGKIQIPDVSKLGTWKITAHFEGDKENAATREFKVEKFVLPSFEVNIGLEQSFILLNAEYLNFTISAKYSHGEQVRGAYHCQFGVVEKNRRNGQKGKPVFLRGLELTGSVQNGTVPTTASLLMADLHVTLQKQNLTLSGLQNTGSQLYLGVFVTNIQSGEIQEAEVYLPIMSRKYSIDLSRTRSYFIPGYPLDVVAVLRLPDGSPAAGVPVRIEVSSTEHWEGTTNQEGAVFPVFNINTDAQITVQVSADGLQQRKEIQKASSPSNSYLYLSFTNRLYSVGELLTVNINAVNGPNNGFMYYMILSRGMLIKQDSLKFGTFVKVHLPITTEMVPSFRLIGYFYDQHGNIIADSVWVDVGDECEIKVKVVPKGPFKPRQQARLEFDLDGQKAKVALLAVDKAIYALKTDNRLTAKQVFSTMQSYDLGCSYTGGSDPASVLTDAGLSFVSNSQSKWRMSFGCNSRSTRQRRAVDLEQEITTLRSNFTDEKLKGCCVHGFSLIPMRKTCEERVRRVSLVEANPLCAEAFLKCCLEGERLRQKKTREDAWKELGRTATIEDIEQYFLENAGRNIRRLFPPSFDFKEFDVNGKESYVIALPDSITTWEIQVITLSAATGFCVVKPSEVRAFQEVFVSLRLPYSVKKYEQLSISPVIYNYGQQTLQLAVHMEQTDGLCSPGSATTTSFVNITLNPESSQFVSFSAVPMVTGSIPIKIRIYDIENEYGLDAIEKTLNVLTEGMETRIEETKLINLDGKSTETFTIDGSLPGETVPDSSSNIFISVEGDGFGSVQAKNLLSPEKVAKLIRLPKGCLEQTMGKLAPTVSAIRYLDLSEQWFELPAGARDKALNEVEQGHVNIINFKNKVDGSYSSFRSVPQSNWVTALVVKLLSFIAQRQAETYGLQGRRARFVPEEEIRHPVRFLLSAQWGDGSFTDQHQVLHRGVLKGADRAMSITAFVALALQRSLPFLNPEGKNNADTVMALEALAEYELKRPVTPEASLNAVFTSPGKRDILKLQLENKKDKVEKDLKKLAGQNINVELTGKGTTKLKVVKAYHLLEPKDECKQVSITVTVEGKVKYTAKVIENYDYYEDYGNNEDKEVPIPQSEIEWFDVQTKNRRDNSKSEDTLTYRVCVSHSLHRNLTGMAIADITLLSGFEVETEDLDILKEEPERYISHYEVSYGRVLIYFNELFDRIECITFDAIQRVPIGLLQPAPAVFYDYYEPNVKCNVFYSAPQRSKLISKLCSEDVCQCAERPCHKIQNTFISERRNKKENRRLMHACFFPTVDYAYMVEVLNVSMKSNFELYRTNIIEELKSHGDTFVDRNSIRVFAKRRQCKGQLDLGKQYLIMGKDGPTTDSNNKMQYLLEANTWVEREPSAEECNKSAHRGACREFHTFTQRYKIDGCRQ
uniref:Complement C4B (Chido/Rodgers blood group) n=1 Tax=Labrus bergylta TaxID=56723 RepID=A0A3Q3LLG4_9LABR